MWLALLQDLEGVGYLDRSGSVSGLKLLMSIYQGNFSLHGSVSDGLLIFCCCRSYWCIRDLSSALVLQLQLRCLIPHAFRALWPRDILNACKLRLPEGYDSVEFELYLISFATFV